MENEKKSIKRASSWFTLFVLLVVSMPAALFETLVTSSIPDLSDLNTALIFNAWFVGLLTGWGLSPRLRENANEQDEAICWRKVVPKLILKCTPCVGVTFVVIKIIPNLVGNDALGICMIVALGVIGGMILAPVMRANDAVQKSTEDGADTDEDEEDEDEEDEDE